MGGVKMTSRYRGFWKELWSRSNEYVSTPAFLSVLLAAPVILISCIALIYEIFYLGHGLKDPAVKLLSVMITAATAGLGASQFSKRTFSEMMGRGFEGDGKPPYTPPGPPRPPVHPAPEQGEKQ
jgi:hypothetical protein